MSTTVQEARTCSTIFQKINDSAYNAAGWVGKSIKSFGSTVADYAQKAADYARPHFDKFKNFVSNHRGPIIIAVVAAAIGMIAYAVISSVFCNRATPAPAPQPNTPELAHRV